MTYRYSYSTSRHIYCSFSQYILLIFFGSHHDRLIKSYTVEKQWYTRWCSDVKLTCAPCAVVSVIIDYRGIIEMSGLQQRHGFAKRKKYIILHD